MAVKVTDKTKIPDLLKIINQLKSKTLKIGVFGKNDSFMVKLAYVHEYGMTITPKKSKFLTIPIDPKLKNTKARDVKGLFRLPKSNVLVTRYGKNLYAKYLLMKSITIPERSYLRSTFDTNKSKIENYANNLLTKVFNFEIDVDTFYNRLGGYCTGLIKKQMTDLKEPANSKITRYTKKSGNPLINTGRLRTSITWKVE